MIQIFPFHFSFQERLESKTNEQTSAGRQVRKNKGQLPIIQARVQDIQLRHWMPQPFSLSPDFWRSVEGSSETWKNGNEDKTLSSRSLWGKHTVLTQLTRKNHCLDASYEDKTLSSRSLWGKHTVLPQLTRKKHYLDAAYVEKTLSLRSLWGKKHRLDAASSLSWFVALDGLKDKSTDVTLTLLAMKLLAFFSGRGKIFYLIFAFLLLFKIKAAFARKHLSTRKQDQRNFFFTLFRSVKKDKVKKQTRCCICNTPSFWYGSDL